jgi:hypothetical protein
MLLHSKNSPRIISALAFLLTEGAFDKAEEWTQLTAAQRSAVKSQYAAAGVKIIVSVFGSTDAPTSSGADPVGTANTMAAFVTQFDLDGIDVDYEVRSEYIRCFTWTSCIIYRTSMRSMLETGRRRLG